MTAAPAPPASPACLAMESHCRAFQARATDALAKVDGRAFEAREWARAEGGGGRMMLLRGEVVEKGAVLFSSVHGTTNPLTGNPFRACGVSLIVHPANPHAPTVHLNLRRFEDAAPAGAAAWWGGGTDLTPMGVRHEEDVELFHGTLRRRLGDAYEAGREEADRYFHVPHRGRARGAGGVFYDHLPDGDAAFDLLERIGEAFLEAYVPILERRAHQPFAPEDRERQLVDRGVYVEFNLLYDRGTRFGFQSGGNPEAILASLPPLVRW